MSLGTDLDQKKNYEPRAVGEEIKLSPEDWQLLPENFRAFLADAALSTTEEAGLIAIANNKSKALQLASAIISQATEQLHSKINAAHFPRIPAEATDEGLDFIFTNAIHRFRKLINVSYGPIKVDPTTKEVFLGVQGRGGVDFEYDRLLKDAIFAMQDLLDAGVDLSAISENDFSAFLGSDYALFRSATERVHNLVVDSEVECSTQTSEVVEKMINQRFSAACESFIFGQELGDAEFAKALVLLDNFFQSIDLIQGVGARSFVSVLPTFRNLIASKNNLNQEQKDLFNTLLEKHEVRIFHLIDFDYMDPDLTNYESFMKHVFGLSDDEMVQRKERGWNQVIDYINTSFLTREKRLLTLSDLREIHAMFSKGVVPYYTLGLRTDRHDEPYNVSVKKSGVGVTKRDGSLLFAGTSSADLDKTMEGFLVEINRVINLPRILDPLANTLMGEMAYRYIRIHPHSEKNGNIAALVIEAAKVLRYNRRSKNFFKKDFFQRLSGAIGPDLLGLFLALR